MQYKYYIALGITLPIVLFAYIVALGYTPLSGAVLALPNETEILLFSLLAGIMAATVGHFIGTRKGLKSMPAAGKDVKAKQQIRIKYLILIGLVIAIFVLPFVINSGAGFGGTDGQGPDAISSSGYTPWIEPLGLRPDALGERVIFSLQVSIGAAILGYLFGYMRVKAPDETCNIK